MGDYRLEFTADPARFLAAAGPLLAAEPVLSTVVATMAHRVVERPESTSAPDEAPSWWLTVRDRNGSVVGAGMRTHPDPPHPPFLLPLPPGAGAALARALQDRGEPLGGINGALPTVRETAEAYAEGAPVSVDVHTRLYELETLTPPPSVPGALRPVTIDDLDVVAPWLAGFGRAAADQAGRPYLGHDRSDPDEQAERARERIARGGLWLWVDPTGVPVHLTGANPPSFGVARVGPVFTPVEHRGHGYAAAAVAAVSAELLAGGSRVCLFTDQTNPVSNAVYQRIGYRPVVDMANLLIGGPDAAHSGIPRASADAALRPPRE